MATIRRRGGLIVATAAICVVLMSATTCVEAESLRGGHRSLIASENTSQYTQFIDNNRRRTEGGEGGDGEGEGEGGGEGQQGNEGGQNEGNNNEGQEGQQQQEGEQQGEQQEQQQGEENGQQNEANEEAEEEVANAYDDIYGDDQSSGGFNMHDTVVGVQDNISNLVDRFDEDVVNMWSMSPSEWDDELWTVFAIVAGAVTLLLSCIFCVCCASFGDNVEEIETDADADKTTPMQKKNHRGRLFNRMRSTDADTVATGVTEAADDKQFHLLDDAVSMSRMPLSPANTKPEDALSPKSGVIGDDEQTKRKKGIFDEAVDVWSEFLGFKKVKSYNTLAFVKRRARDEASYIDKDDDMTRMTRSRSGRSRRRSSSKASRRRGRQMDAGSYVAPTESISDRNRLSVQTPVIAEAEPSSPRSTRSRSTSRTRAALIKGRSLLKNFRESFDSKGEKKDLLSKKESDNLNMVVSASSSHSA